MSQMCEAIGLSVQCTRQASYTVKDPVDGATLTICYYHHKVWQGHMQTLHGATIGTRRFRGTARV